VKSTKAVESVAALARILNRHRGTCLRWTQRPDWPVRRSPPWSAAQARTIRLWAATLQEDRREELSACPEATDLLLQAYPELGDPDYLRRFLEGSNNEQA
jgi:hypothetical protein